ncbi:hypothetical protein GIB67_016512 [Kingdonia uniflora]|uniref:DUF4283 domain-containing protein n=1 Tax=Kingdonia uniflora TaxID=39325 RepID=A0A7J7MQX5_9MAGN|nr:hypothetical protein GIB67_016512 [Kingdonia uniflora]
MITQRREYKCVKLCPKHGENIMGVCTIYSRELEGHTNCVCHCCNKGKDRVDEDSGDVIDIDKNHTKATMSWANIIGKQSKGRGKSALIYTPPTIVNGSPVIEVIHEDYANHKNEYEGYLVGRRLAFPFLRETLNHLWGLKGDFKMSLENDCTYFFKFDLQEDKEKVLELGHQFIASRVFLIRPWRLFIEAEATTITAIPIWIVLRNIPVHMRHPKGIARVASAIGKPICLDRATEEKTRNEFDRVSVEIEQPTPSDPSHNQQDENYQCFSGIQLDTP